MWIFFKRIVRRLRNARSRRFLVFIRSILLVYRQRDCRFRFERVVRLRFRTRVIFDLRELNKNALFQAQTFEVCSKLGDNSSCWAFTVISRSSIVWFDGFARWIKKSKMRNHESKWFIDNSLLFRQIFSEQKVTKINACVWNSTLEKFNQKIELTWWWKIFG